MHAMHALHAAHGADEVLLQWMGSPTPDLWRLPARINLERLEDLIRIHRVAAWLDAHGRNHLRTLSPALAETVRMGALAAAARERLDRETRRAVLTAFDGLGLDFIPLKGSVLGPWLYANAAQRPAHDLDILVAKHDLPRARLALLDLGYREADREGTPWSDAWSHEQAFWRGDDLPVELHSHVTQPERFGLAVAGLFSRACAWEWEGLALRRLHADDQFLSLIIHAAHHQFLLPLMQWVDLRLLLDRGINLKAVLRRASDAGALTAVRMAGIYLHRYFGDERLLWAAGMLTPARRALLSGLVPRILPAAPTRGFWRDRWTAFWLLDQPVSHLGFSAGYAARWVLDRPFVWGHQNSRQSRAWPRRSGRRRTEPSSALMSSGRRTSPQSTQ